MAGELSRLLIRFGIDTSALNKAEPQVKKSLGNIERHVHTLRNSVLSLAGAAGFGGLGYTAMAVTREFMGFEDAMLKVKAVAKPTADEFKRLQELARDLSTQTEYSSGQIAAGMYELSSAGLNAEQQLKTMPALLDLATAGQLEMGTAAQVVVQSLAGFKLGSEQAVHITDVLAEAVNKTMLHFEDLALSMRYVAPIAGTTGQSIEVMTAALGLMSQAGIRGEQAGTTLRGAFVRLMDPTNEVISGMKTLHLNAKLMNPALNSLSTILAEVRDKTEGVDAATKNQALSQVFGTEALSGMLALVNAGPEALDALTKSLKESDGAAKTTAETMRESLSTQIKILKNNVIEALYPAFERLKPALDGVIAKIKEWAEEGRITAWVRDALNALKSMYDILVSVWHAINGVVHALGGWKNALIGLGIAWAGLKLSSWVTTIGHVVKALAGIKIGGGLLGAAGAGAGAAAGGAALTGTMADFAGTAAAGGTAAAAGGVSMLAVAGGVAAAAAAGYGLYRVLKFSSDEARKTAENTERMSHELKRMGVEATGTVEVYSAVGQAVKMIVPAAKEAADGMQAIPQAIVGALQSEDELFTAMGRGGLVAYVQGLLENAGYTESAAAGVVQSIVTQLQSSEQGAREAGVRQIKALVDAMVANGNLAAETAKQINDQINQAFSESAPGATGSAGGDLLPGVTAFLEKMNATIEQGKKLGSTTFGTGYGGVGSLGLTGISEDIKQALASPLPDIRQQGYEWMAALANGMAQGNGIPEAGAQQVYMDVLAQLKSGDPAMMQTAINTMTTYAIGLQAGKKAPLDETVALVQEIANSVGGSVDYTLLGSQTMGAYAAGLAAKIPELAGNAQQIGAAITAGLSSNDPQVVADAARMLDDLLTTLVAKGEVTQAEAAEYHQFMAENLGISDSGIPGSYEVVLNEVQNVLDTKGGDLIQRSKEIRDQVKANLDASVRQSPAMTESIPASYSKLFSRIRQVFNANLPQMTKNLSALGFMASPAAQTMRVTNNEWHYHVTGYMDAQALEGLAKGIISEAQPRLQAAEVGAA